ncbi:MAG: histidine kinase [Clostridia bacterium]|nr:histidine kinase [Clostridia bacterium]
MNRRFLLICVCLVWAVSAAMPLAGGKYLQKQAIQSAQEQAKTQAELLAEQLLTNISLAVTDKQAALAPPIQQLLKAETPEEFSAAAQSLQAALPGQAGSGIGRIRVYYSGGFGNLPESIYGAVLPLPQMSALPQEQRIRTAQSGPLLLCGPMQYAYCVESDPELLAYVLMDLEYDVTTPRTDCNMAIIAGNEVFSPGEPLAETITQALSHGLSEAAGHPVTYVQLPELDASIAVFSEMNANELIAPLWPACMALAGLLTCILIIIWLKTKQDKNRLAAAIRETLSLEENNSEPVEKLLDVLFEKMEALKKEMDINRRLHREAELNAWQMRLNPHLLYNALSTVSWMAMEAGNEQLLEIVKQLARFYRASLAEAGQTATVAEAVEQIRDYLAIYKIAMDAFFEVEIDAPEDIKEIQILHLLLQPLVENAVVHGLEPRHPGGMLWLKFRKKGDMLHITIADNGTGVSQNATEKFQNDRHSGLGLRLVQSRLRFYYGDRAGLTLTAREGGGTVAEVVFPIEGS